MATLGELVIQITGDTSGLKKALGDAEKQAGGLGKALGDVTKIASGFVVAQGFMQLPGLVSGAADAASRSSSPQRLSALR